jgi:hypothetical protein
VIKPQWWHSHAGYLPEAVDVQVGEDPAADVTRITRQLWADQGKGRKQRQLECTEVYYGCDWSGDDEDGGDRSALAGIGIEPDPTGYNVIQSITDTSVSRLVQNRIRPLILTENGNAEQQQQAQSLQKVVEGTFWDAKIYGELGEHVCFDGHLFDAGGVKVYPDYAGKRLVLDRIDPSRFMVSLRESQLGNPRSGYYYDAIDRSELLAMFRDATPGVIKAIEDVPVAPHDLAHGGTGRQDDFVDDVEVFEAWHLPSSSVDRDDPKAWGIDEDGEFDPRLDPGHDGRRVLCIDGQTLIDEPWPFPYFPIAWFKPMRKRRSYWSRSVPEVLAGAQIMLNTMNARVDAIMHFHGRPLMYFWKNAKVNVSKVTNGVATILEGNVPPGQAFQTVVAQAVPGEYLNRIDKIIAWAERQWGMNEMALTGAKPAGIDHAPGMQHLSDELSARHTTKMHAWERMHQDLAQLVIDGHRMLADYCKANGEDYTVVFGGDRDLEEIDWKKADLGKAVYRVKVWPTNLLPQTPAAKANTLIEWMQAGLITAEQALTMVDHPDTESLVGDHVAKRKNIEKKLDRLVAGDKFEQCMPTPYIDLDLGLQICSNRLNRFEADGYPDKVLQQLRNWYMTCQNFIDQKAAKAAELQAAALGKGPVPPPSPLPLPPGAGGPPTGAPPMPPGPMPPAGPPGPQAPPMAA